MIDPLSFEDCHAAYLTLRHPLGVELGFDPNKVAALLHGHRTLFDATADRPDPEQVLELVTHMIPVCAGLSMLGGQLDCQYGLHVADRWLTHNGWMLLADEMDKVRLLETLAGIPTLPMLPSDAQLDAVRAWAGRTIADAATCATLAEHTGTVEQRRPLQCFLACPLTSMSGEKLAFLRALCDIAASVLADYGVLTIRPELYTEFTARDRNDPVYRQIDESLIASSDVVLVVAAQKSLGLGVVASMAQRYHKHLVVATGARVVTPMITGLDPSPTIIRLGAVEDELRQHLDAVLPSIEESSSRSRRAVSEIGAEVARRRALAEGRRTGKADEQYGLVLNRARFQELMNHPELLAGATYLEVRELFELLGD